MAYKNFTIVGSPTITDNGIASGFSSSNYIEYSNLDTTKPWNITLKFNVTSITSQSILKISSPPAGENYVVLSSAGSLQLRLREIFTSSDDIKTANNFVQTNTDYKIDIGWTGTQYYFKIDNVEIGHLNSTTPLTNNNSNIIGAASGFYLTDGSVDLREFKIFVNDNLVYQPYSTDFKFINRVYNRHDTSSNFTTNNPILGDGELALETDTGRAKVGDGSTAYASLPHIGDVTAIMPLTFGDIERKNKVIVQYTQDETGVYSMSGKYNTVGTAYNIFISDDGGYINDIFDAGYIDIPYNFGEIVSCGSAATKRCPNAAFFGHIYPDGRFVPILSVVNTDYNCYIYRVTSTSYSPGSNMMYMSTSYLGNGYAQGRVTIHSDDALVSETIPYPWVKQIVKTSTGFTIVQGAAYTYGTTKPNKAYLATLDVTADSVVEAISQINNVRVLMTQEVYSDSAPLTISNLGKYAEQTLTIDNWGTAGGLGTNLFDIDGSVITNKAIQLTVGDGLIINPQSGVVSNKYSQRFQGTYGQQMGKMGLVPAPFIGEEDKVLKGNGMWDSIGSGITNFSALTQAQYDALVSGGTVDATTMYVIIPASNNS